MPFLAKGQSVTVLAQYKDELARKQYQHYCPIYIRSFRRLNTVKKMNEYTNQEQDQV